MPNGGTCFKNEECLQNYCNSLGRCGFGINALNLTLIHLNQLIKIIINIIICSNEWRKMR